MWQSSRVDDSRLLHTLTDNSKPSEYLRLLVLDGFALYDSAKRIRHISLPVGELKVCETKELDTLLRLPQSASLDRVPDDLAEQLNRHHILAVRQREPYRGQTGLWVNERMISRLSFVDLDDLPRESDIDLFGPLFLSLGDSANLAEELRLRTNVFDGLPCNRLTRNGYLPWDRIDNEGNPYPRSTVVQVGNDGELLKTIYEAWMAVNNLSNDGFLRTPTQTFAGAIMDLHKAEYRQAHLRVPFLGLITSLESVLVADSHTDLAYKTALRGSALLTHRPEERWKAFRILNRFYTIRSKIVHSGSPGDVGLDELIHVGLLEMCQQILLRYIFLIYQGLRGLLPSWVIPSKDVFGSRSKRPQAISKVLDIAVVDPKLIIKLEKFLDKHGLLEKNLWKNRHVLDILLPEKK